MVQEPPITPRPTFFRRQSTLQEPETFTTGGGGGGILSAATGGGDVSLAASPITAVLVWTDIADDDDDDGGGDGAANNNTSSSVRRLSTLQDAEKFHGGGDVANEMVNIHRWVFRAAGRGIPGVMAVTVYQVAIMIGMTLLLVYGGTESTGICDSSASRYSQGSWFTGLALAITRRLLWGSDDVKKFFDYFEGYMGAAAAFSTLQVVDLAWRDRPICSVMFDDNELLELIWLGVVLVGWYSTWDSQLRWMDGSQMDVRLVVLLNPVGLVTWCIQYVLRVYVSGSARGHALLMSTCWPCCCCCAGCTHCGARVLKTILRVMHQFPIHIALVGTTIIAVCLSVTFNVGGFGGFGVAILLGGAAMIGNSCGVDRLLWVVWWLYLLLFHTDHIRDILKADGQEDLANAGWIAVLVLYVLGCERRREQLAGWYALFEPIGWSIAWLKYRLVSVSLADLNMTSALREAHVKQDVGALNVLLQSATPSDVWKSGIWPDVNEYASNELKKRLRLLGCGVRTPLHEAAETGDIGKLEDLMTGKNNIVFKCLMGKKSVTDPLVWDENDDTPLHVAAREGHIDVVKFFIEECKLDPRMRRDKDGNNSFNISSGQVQAYFILTNSIDPLAESADRERYLQKKSENNSNILAWIDNDDEDDGSNRDNPFRFSSLPCARAFLKAVREKVEREDTLKRERQAAIERQMKTEMETHHDRVKCLLLGSGESGKSTFFKQIVLQFGRGFEERDRSAYVPVIHRNMVDALQTILYQAEFWGMQIPEPMASEVREWPYDMFLTEEHANIVDSLWKDDVVQTVYARRSEFQLVDAANYFLENARRILKPQYVPTTEDLIRTRVRTTGIVETRFTIDHTEFDLIDVGGMRNERKKWIHVFQDIDIILFTVAISSYDEVLYEDSTTNRLKEAESLFEQIVTNRFFENATIVVLFTKWDLFCGKIDAGVPITSAYPDYNGNNNDIEECAQYIQDRFAELHNKEIIFHRVCLTDSQHVNVVMNALSDVAIRKKLADNGLL